MQNFDEKYTVNYGIPCIQNSNLIPSPVPNSKSAEVRDNLDSVSML